MGCRWWNAAQCCAGRSGQSIAGQNSAAAAQPGPCSLNECSGAGYREKREAEGLRAELDEFRCDAAGIRVDAQQHVAMGYVADTDRRVQASGRQKLTARKSASRTPVFRMVRSACVVSQVSVGSDAARNTARHWRQASVVRTKPQYTFAASPGAPPVVAGG